MRKITKIGKRWVKVSVEDWPKMWAAVRASQDCDVTRSFGGGCDDFCGAACADNEGCDLSFGNSPDCGALCNDGEVFLSEEV